MELETIEITKEYYKKHIRENRSQKREQEKLEVKKITLIIGVLEKSYQRVTKILTGKRKTKQMRKEKRKKVQTTEDKKNQQNNKNQFSIEKKGASFWFSSGTEP